MSRPRVVVAMSGGVDSSVAALLLRQQGWEVVGISLLLSPAANGSPGHQGCCSAEDFRDARRVADRLQIPYYALNFREEFQRLVIDQFTEAYLSGQTPNPCLLCNQELKFKLLRERALQLGARWLATGHYARIERDQAGSHYRLLKARDRQKDQSYFLFMLSQKELSQTLFPLGSLEKSEVREFAREFALPVADKPESQEICFVPNNDYASFVEGNVPAEKIKPGPIVDQTGKKIGKHKGIHRFTIGQRRGLAVASPTPLYVTAIDPDQKLVKVAPRETTKTSGLVAEQLTWITEPFSGEAEVRTRYRQQPVPAVITPQGRRQVTVRFLARFPAVAPGQAVVFYRGEEVLGGGVIIRGL